MSRNCPHSPETPQSSNRLLIAAVLSGAVISACHKAQVPATNPDLAPIVEIPEVTESDSTNREHPAAQCELNDPEIDYESLAAIVNDKYDLNSAELRALLDAGIVPEFDCEGAFLNVSCAKPTKGTPEDPILSIEGLRVRVVTTFPMEDGTRIRIILAYPDGTDQGTYTYESDLQISKEFYGDASY
jgi:hypothetical protein